MSDAAERRLERERDSGDEYAGYRLERMRERREAMAQARIADESAQAFDLLLELIRRRPFSPDNDLWDLDRLAQDAAEAVAVMNDRLVC